ncbi:MAG: hypothetical protein V8Q43_01775 [Christensenellaceae bacterium]
MKREMMHLASRIVWRGRGEIYLLWKIIFCGRSVELQEHAREGKQQRGTEQIGERAGKKVGQARKREPQRLVQCKDGKANLGKIPNEVPAVQGEQQRAAAGGGQDEQDTLIADGECSGGQSQRTEQHQSNRAEGRDAKGMAQDEADREAEPGSGGKHSEAVERIGEPRAQKPSQDAQDI